MLPTARCRSTVSLIGFLLLIIALSEAFQVRSLRPHRRRSLSPRVVCDENAAARVIKREENASRNQGFLSELQTYSNGISEVRGGSNIVSKRLGLSTLAVLLTVTLPKLAPSLQSLFEAYSQCLVTNPLVTKVLTGAVLATLGDALAQAGDNKPYDAARASSFAAFDSCYRVFQHAAFPFVIGNCQGRVLSRLISALPGLTVEATPALAVFERVFTYQMCVVPLLYYPGTSVSTLYTCTRLRIHANVIYSVAVVFFALTGYMQGLDAKGSFQRAKANFLPCWKKNLMFWVPIQAVMFGLIPQRFQVSFTCVMGILWSLILSLMAGKAKKE